MPPPNKTRRRSVLTLLEMTQLVLNAECFFSGCPNQNIGWPFIFIELKVGKSFYLGPIWVISAWRTTVSTAVETPHCRCRRKPEALGAGRIHSCFRGKYCTRSELNPCAYVFKETLSSIIPAYNTYKWAYNTNKSVVLILRSIRISQPYTLTCMWYKKGSQIKI
jgi:hypothetical protein